MTGANLIVPFLVHLGECDVELALRRFAGTRQLLRDRARNAAASASLAFPHTRARRLPTITDVEAFRRPLGGHFRDASALRQPGTSSQLAGPVRFSVSDLPARARRRRLHVSDRARTGQAVRIASDRPAGSAEQRDAHGELDRICASTEYVVRLEGRQKAFGSLEPHAAREFRNRDLAWLIHRQIYLRRIDVLQLEYTVLGQYYGGYRRIPSFLFEHDVYFQSVARRLPFMASAFEKLQARWEYLRALRFELRLLPKLDRVQVCTRENADYLTSFLPCLKGRIDDDNRAGIDTSSYEFHGDQREPHTLLFLGSFRHPPNQEALNWFLANVFPKVRSAEPRVRLIVIGSDPPPRHSLPDDAAIELLGFVEDIREPLARYSVFVCPILSGSGIRVKLLEAFAAGIPVVSTRIGAEGLASVDGEFCALADDPEAFAQAVLKLLADPAQAAEMARRARTEVVATRDMRTMTEKLVESYRREVERMRLAANGR